MKIDIILAAYNGRKYIKEQIDSILSQSFTDFRLLIRDDDSTDGTSELIDMYEALHPDRIKVIRDGKRAGGAKNNFFLLLLNTEADYVMFADQDDYWESDKVEKAYHYIRKAEKKVGKNVPILCHGDPKVANSRLNVISPSMGSMQKLDFRRRKLNDYLVQNNVTGCTMIINRALKDHCRVMPEEAIMHDWWLALIASAFGRVFFMGSVPMLYRQHGNNAEGVKNLKSPIYIIKRLFGGKKTRETLQRTYRQAESFKEIFSEENEPSLDLEKSEIVSMYLSIPEKRKAARLMTIFQYKFRKSGVARELGYIFYV